MKLIKNHPFTVANPAKINLWYDQVVCYNQAMKKNIVLLFFFLIILIPQVFAVEEVFLDVEGETPENIVKENSITDKSKSFEPEGKTLLEKIAEINSEEITDTSKPHYLLEEILTKNFESSPVESARVFGYYRGGAVMYMNHDDIASGYDYSTVEGGVNGKFRGSNNFYEARLRFTPQHNHTFFQFMPSNLYIANKSIPHHTVIVGNTRVATGHEGLKSSSVIPFFARSQISRNFGNIRKVGVRVIGNYDLVEYDLGGFSSDTYFREFFPGAEFAGWVTVKPLGKTGGKYGMLKLGSGLTAGHKDIDYTVLGAYASYEYKKLYANFEWGKADGYNGFQGLFDNKAEGFYTTLGYKITPKLQLVSRYDQYRPNLDISHNMQREYSAGVNYFIKGQSLKLILNYVFCQNDAKKDSHKIILGTQLML